MTKLLSAIALSAFIVGPALADGTVLTDNQMDQVSAGISITAYNVSTAAQQGASYYGVSAGQSFVAFGNGTAQILW